MTTTTKPALRAHRPMTRMQVRAELEEAREMGALLIHYGNRLLNLSGDIWEATQIDEAPAYMPMRSRAS